MVRKILLSIFALMFFVSASVFAMEKININKATAPELEKLKGVGPKIAQKIIEYRDKNGPFKKPEDITLVKGIGPKIMEENKDLISVGDGSAVEAKPAKEPVAAPAPEKPMTEKAK